MKAGTLIQAMNQLRSGNYAGILSGAISEVQFPRHGGGS